MNALVSVPFVKPASARKIRASRSSAVVVRAAGKPKDAPPGEQALFQAPFLGNRGS